MQQHHANQNPDERLAVALWWKSLWDEDRVGPAVAWRHRWSQAGLVSVDHDGEEWWNLERPSVCDIPCTSELLLSQAAEFFSCYFLEALLDMYMCERCDLYVYTRVHVCVFENTFLHFFLPSLLSISLTMWQFYFWPVKNTFPWRLLYNLVLYCHYNI